MRQRKSNGIQLRRNEALLGLTILAGIALAVFLFSRSSKATDVSLTSAALVPDDAVVFVGFNTDLKSSQWAASFDLAEKLGLPDPRESIKGLVESGQAVAPAKNFHTEGNPATYAGVHARVVADLGYGESMRVVTGSLAPSNANDYVGFEIYNERGDKFDKGERIPPGTKVRLRKLGPGGSTGYLVAGLSWEDDVEPFLGGDAAFFVRSVDKVSLSPGLDDVRGGVIFRADNPGEAWKRVNTLAADSATEEEYEGVSYLKTETGFAARIDQHIVFATDLSSMHAVIDAHKGKRNALAESRDFQSLRDRLTTNFLTFVYVDAKAIAANPAFNDPTISGLVDTVEDRSVNLRPFAVVLGAKQGSFEIAQAAIAGGPAEGGPALQPRLSRFVSLVPIETMMFASTTGIKESWKDIPEDDRGVADMLWGQGLTLPSRTEINKLVDLMTGEVAFASWFARGQASSPRALILAEVADLSAAAPLLDEMAAAAGGTSRTEQVGAFTMRIQKPLSGSEIAFAVGPDFVAIGSPEGVRQSLAKDKPSLGQLGAYTRAVSATNAPLGSYFFMNLDALSRLSGADGFASMATGFADPFEAMLINAVVDGDTIRTSGVMTIQGN
ncbi:MAG: DUF3352 domain-containing protein [Dehalococcoidia bacterium]